MEMEREIKFEYGFQSVNDIVKKQYYLHEIPYIQQKCDVFNDLPIVYVRQYTGLKDKNGKEIYEGDIILDLKAVEPEDKGFVVVWVNNGFKLKTNFIINGFLDHFELFDTSKHEIIGNIYENKELLK